MSDLRLRDFADQAQTLVALPDLDDLERRGSELRRRRRSLVVAALVVLALLGTWVLRETSPKAIEPVRPIEPKTEAQPYPGNHMRDLPAGTYRLQPSAVEGEPTALITVPEGWNTWEGPNRYDGHLPGLTNEEALAHQTWYVGALVVKLVAVTDRVCEGAFSPDSFVDGYEATVAALSRVPGYRLTGGPEEVEAFGYPATHLTLRATSKLDACDTDADVYATSNNGSFPGVDRGEVWVVDVHGVPLTVFASRAGRIPPRIEAELDGVIGSIEFVVPED